MNCLKLLGERDMSRDPGRQTAEIQIRIAIMNHFPALSGTEIEVVAELQAGKGQLTPE